MSKVLSIRVIKRSRAARRITKLRVTHTAGATEVPINTFRLLIGPEVVREGLKVLSAAADRYNFELNTVDYDLGGERYLKTGEVLPDSVRA